MAAPAVYRTEDEFLAYLCGFKALVYIIGYNKQQYENLDEAVDKVSSTLHATLNVKYGKGAWAVIYGGDPLDAAKPDIALLVDRLRREHGMTLIAVQAEYVDQNWGGVGSHVDAVYYYPTEFREDGAVAWGGFSPDRNPVGTTRVLLDVVPRSDGAPLTYWLAAGGGAIGKDELVAARDRGLPINALPAAARYPAEAEAPLGPCWELWGTLSGDPDDELPPFKRATAPA